MTPEEAVNHLEADVLDRRGLKWEFVQIEPDVRKEIRSAWLKIVRRVYWPAFWVGWISASVGALLVYGIFR